MSSTTSQPTWGTQWFNATSLCMDEQPITLTFKGTVTRLRLTKANGTNPSSVLVAILPENIADAREIHAMLARTADPVKGQ